jgi:hypothetical protein
VLLTAAEHLRDLCPRSACSGLLSSLHLLMLGAQESLQTRRILGLQLRIRLVKDELVSVLNDLLKQSEGLVGH